MAGGKCQWVCIPVLGGFKTVVSLCLIIIAIVMMAHSGMDCEGVTKCYKDNGITQCSTSWSPTRRRRTRRLSSANASRDSYAASEIELGAKTETTPVANAFLGIELPELKLVKMIEQLKAKKGATRRLAGKTCYASWDEQECKADNESIRKESANWGAVFMVIGLVSILSGCCSFAVGKLKQRRWMIMTMITDIITMIVGAGVCALGYYIATIIGIICTYAKDNADELESSCWDDNVAKVCEWAGMFFWGSVMVTILCIIMTVASILDCTATCCCPPEDAHWIQQKPPPVGTPAQIGAPVVGVAVEAETNETKL